MLVRAFIGALLFVSSPSTWVAAFNNRGDNGIAPKNPVDDMCKQITPMPTFGEIYAEPEAITPAFTKELISSRMMGMSVAECIRLTDLVIEVTRIHPTIENYVRLIFTHSPLFRIIKDDLKAASLKTGAQYSTNHITMSIRSSMFNKADQSIIAILRHECRHAAINTAYRILGLHSPFSVDIYFPNTPAQKKAILEMLDEGTQNISHLKELLHHKTKADYKLATLTPDQTERLNYLGDEDAAVYAKYYRIAISRTLPQAVLAKVNGSAPDHYIIKKGAQIKLDGYLSNFLAGLITLTNVEVYKNDPSMTTLVFKMADVLYAMLNYHDSINEVIESPNYKKIGTQILEKDAYLNQLIPQNLFQKMYPRLFNHTNSLINRAAAVPVTYQKRSVIDYTAEDTDKRVAREFDIEFSNPNFFFSPNKDDYIKLAVKKLEKNEFTVVKKAMLGLLRRKLFPGDANQILSLIAFEEKEYAASVKYLDEAKKHPILPGLNTPEFETAARFYAKNGDRIQDYKRGEGARRLK